MSRLYVQSEGTAARRRFPVYLVDATDGVTPETGESAGQPQISKAGGAWGNTSATLTAIGNGAYYVELTAGELDTLGSFQIRFKSANTAEFNMDGEVVAVNIHDTVRMGLTALPNVASGNAGAIITAGTGTAQLSVDTGRGLADVRYWSAVAVATPDTTGYPKVTLKTGTGTGELSITSGVASANVTQFGGAAGTFASGRPEVNTTHAAGTAWGSGAITAAAIATNAIDADALAADAVAEINATVDAALADIHLDHLLSSADPGGAVANNSLWAKLHANGVTADYTDYDNDDRSLMALGTYLQSLDEVDLPAVLNRLPTALVSGRMDASVGAMAANTLTASALATDAVAEIQSGLSTVTTAQVNAEVDTALADIHLDHLFGSADPGGVVADNSFWAKLHASGVTADYTDYDHTSRSLMALGTYAQSLDEVDLPNVLTQIAALAASIAALPDAAAINAQVLDVLTVDTFAEPSAVPAATATIAGKIGWLAALARNKLTQTATTQTLRNDADDANIATATHADDGTTHTRSEWT